MPDKRVAALALEAGIGGFHFYHGIPGAHRRRAAHERRRQRRRDARAGRRGARASTAQGNVHTLTNADMGYAYRHSSAPQDLIFTSAVFEGYPEEQGQDQGRRWTPCSIIAKRCSRSARRPAARPSRIPKATSAWKVIDEAGCRGLMIGGAQMSPMHCNFMINTGNATGYDLEYLGETVRARVLETFRHPAGMGDQAHRPVQARPRGAGVSRAAALIL